MAEKRMIKIVTLLTVICFLLQLIPVTATFAFQLQNHSPDSGGQTGEVFLTINFLQTDTLFVRHENLKEPLQRGQGKGVPLSAGPTSTFSLSSIKASVTGMSLDRRKVIRQSIPNYFNGSKYVDNSLVVCNT